MGQRQSDLRRHVKFEATCFQGEFYGGLAVGFTRSKKPRAMEQFSADPSSFRLHVRISKCR